VARGDRVDESVSTTLADVTHEECTSLLPNLAKDSFAELSRERGPAYFSVTLPAHKPLANMFQEARVRADVQGGSSNKGSGRKRNRYF